MLDQAAVDAVKQWQFQPTLLNGMAVPVIMTVTVNFLLDRGATVGATPPPPPPPPPAELVNGQAPVRVGGNIKPPENQNARPNYPTDALAARVQGVVILETTIDQSATSSAPVCFAASRCWIRPLSTPSISRGSSSRRC